MLANDVLRHTLRVYGPTTHPPLTQSPPPFCLPQAILGSSGQQLAALPRPVANSGALVSQGPSGTLDTTNVPPPPCSAASDGRPISSTDALVNQGPTNLPPPPSSCAAAASDGRPGHRAESSCSSQSRSQQKLPLQYNAVPGHGAKSSSSGHHPASLLVGPQPPGTVAAACKGSCVHACACAPARRVVCDQNLELLCDIDMEHLTQVCACVCERGWGAQLHMG